VRSFQIIRSGLVIQNCVYKRSVILYCFIIMSKFCKDIFWRLLCNFKLAKWSIIHIIHMWNCWKVNRWLDIGKLLSWTNLVGSSDVIPDFMYGYGWGFVGCPPMSLHIVVWALQLLRLWFRRGYVVCQMCVTIAMMLNVSWWWIIHAGSVETGWIRGDGSLVTTQYVPFSWILGRDEWWTYQILTCVI
jgi:hypothetical protein